MRRTRRSLASLSSTSERNRWAKKEGEGRGRRRGHFFSLSSRRKPNAWLSYTSRLPRTHVTCFYFTSGITEVCRYKTTTKPSLSSGTNSRFRRLRSENSGSDWVARGAPALSHELSRVWESPRHGKWAGTRKKKLGRARQSRTCLSAAAPQEPE